MANVSSTGDVGQMSSTVSNYQRPESGPQSRGSRETEASRVKKRGFELSVSQVVVLWSIMAGLLIMCFLFGFYAGRQQGLRVAFEQYSGQAARIPIADPVASENSLNELLADTSTTKSDVPVAAVVSEEESKFDFSAEGKVPVATAKPVPVEEAMKPSETTEITAVKTSEKVIVKQSAPKKPAAISVTEVKTLSPPTPGWYIQIAATKTKEDADRIATKIKSRNYLASHEMAKVGNSTYYRVLVGPYTTRAEAEKNRQKISKKKLTKAAPFLKRVR